MCTTCGCSGQAHSPGNDGANAPHEHVHPHSHGHRQGPQHEDAPPAGSLIRLEQQILARNDELARHNRSRLDAQGVFAINLMSAPGAGKTTLLERTMRELDGRLPLQVIEGDQATDHDARRLRQAGCPVVQINTGAGCHLDAAMVDRGLRELPVAAGSLLVIENVGNLVCPALFDLGEHARVVVAAVTDGDDKPVKYPHMFRAADLILLNKSDLLPYVPFDRGRFEVFARQVNPEVTVLPLSAGRGDGFGRWIEWLLQQAHHGAE